MKTPLIGILALIGCTTAFSAGCAAHAHASGMAEAEAPVVFMEAPTLVATDANVWVVRNADHATYYVEDCYWVYRDGTWYKSRSYEHGWAVIEKSDVPAAIVSRDHGMYVHFEGAANAQTRPAPRGEAVASSDGPPPAAGNPHGGPPGHDELPGVGNQRKAEGEQPGNAHDVPAAPAAKKDDKKDEKTDDKKVDKKSDKKGGPKKK